MKVFLSGYNLDTDVIEELKSAAAPRLDITPETLSAAYARISRDPRPINELRQDARREVEKTRKSNQAIIFGLGHSSVAEHAVFNFDILDLSRYAMEELEKFRLCSFTEKSQRYITLDSAYYLPLEIKGTRFEKTFLDILKQQNDLYYRLFEKLKTYVFTNNAALAEDPKNKNLLEGWAKENARYTTSLATTSQVGMTVNARNLEKILRRFASHPLKEIRNLGQGLHALVKDITPSIIKYPEANDFDKNTYRELAQVITSLTKNTKPQRTKNCTLIDYTKDGDQKILTALTAKLSKLDWQTAQKAVKKMQREDVKNIFKACVKNMQVWDQMLREFELVDLTFELVVSASCFAQLKRHRMTTQITGNYDPALGLHIPKSIQDIGMAEEFTRIAGEGGELYQALLPEIPEAAEYVLTNAHQRRVICKTNLRELYHISRLREDAHAQWDIREIAAQMSVEAQKVLPLTTGFIGGKDKFQELREKLFS